MKYMHAIGLQIAGLYCQPFFSQFSKAKTSKGHFQSQIDYSTQGKPLQKASRRPREQNASLCSGRVHGVYRTRPPRKPAARGSPSAVRIALAGGGRLRSLSLSLSNNIIQVCGITQLAVEGTIWSGYRVHTVYLDPGCSDLFWKF